MDASKPDSSLIQAAFQMDSAESVDVHVFDRLDSTSEWLRGQRESLCARVQAGHTQLCVTDWQQAGVGRRGKTWQTQPGNVTVSMLSRVDRPAKDLMGLSLVTGIAVAEALEDVLGAQVMLKWPNDIILDDQKLGGLLTELMPVTAQRATQARGSIDESQGEQKCQLTSGSGTDVITGIGVNVRHDPAVEALGIGATALQQAGFELLRSERDALVGRICAKVLASHRRFLTLGWGAFSALWEQRDWLMGKAVSIHSENSTEHAVAYGVNEQGALLVERAGKLLPLYGGNVSIRRTE